MGSASEKEALDHAWNWFALHANQRLQCLHFFVLISAALAAGAASAFSQGKFGIALIIAAVGVGAAVSFNALERRVRELVKAGEDAMREFQRRLAEETGVPQLQLVAEVDATRVSRTGSYSKAINGMHGLAIAAWFVVGSVAFWWKWRG